MTDKQVENLHSILTRNKFLTFFTAQKYEQVIQFPDMDLIDKELKNPSLVQDKKELLKMIWYRSRGMFEKSNSQIPNCFDVKPDNEIRFIAMLCSLIKKGNYNLLGDYAGILRIQSEMESRWVKPMEDLTKVKSIKFTQSEDIEFLSPAEPTRIDLHLSGTNQIPWSNPQSIGERGPHLDATVDGATVNFLFDSGSSKNWLESSKKPLPAFAKSYNISDALGRHTEVDYMQRSNLQVGGLSVKNPHFAVSDRSGNILGWTYFRNSGSFLISENGITLHAKRPENSEVSLWSSTLAGSEAYIQIPVTDGKTTRLAIFDTGADVAGGTDILIIKPHFTPDELAKSQNLPVLTYSSTKVMPVLSMYDDLKVGNLPPRHMKITVIKGEAPQMKIVLTSRILRYASLWVDGRNGRISLMRNIK
ncbi:retropepsin-like aspartic protease [Novacetimonas pomaceti]|uniref:retropepsin-like aspartic protease n=1 Tax=Novacetimonas pomaceti TaxID=2021998 RepID=UPI001C2DA0BB|nr:retropepsin-like aspartic protease [Novacetimonas pomaceti]MBV1835186.1 retropepsin-like domain-containing protein [Novacetimonas pomaceti]